MKTRAVKCALLLLCLAPLNSASIQYPPTRSDPNSLADLGHTKVPDPYQWLEGDIRTDKEVAAWVQKQHDFGESILNDVGGVKRQQFADGMRSICLSDRTSAYFSNGRWFVQRHTGLRDFAVLYWAQGMDLDEILRSAGQWQIWTDDESASPTKEGVTSRGMKVLLDPHTLSQDSSVAVANFHLSPDANLVLYQLRKNGSDWTTLRIKRFNVTTQEYEDDPDHVIEWLKFTDVNVLKDNSGIYYTRYDVPAQKDTAHQAITVNPRIVFYNFATKEETEIFRDTERPFAVVGSSIVSLQRYLLITQLSQEDSTKARILIQDRWAGLTSPVYPIYDDFAARRDFIGSIGDKFYFETDKDAPRGRIVSKVIIAANLAEHGKETEVISQSGDPGRSIQSSGVWGDGTLILHSTVHVRDEVKIMNIETGKLLFTFELPSVGSISLLHGGDFVQGAIYYSFSSFHVDNIIYKYDAWTGRHIKVYETPSPFSSDDFVVEQVFIPSKNDAVKIPAFIAHKKTLVRDGTNPTILYGYGGFSVSLSPMFSPRLPVWLDTGGVYVEASIRGGGEYGRDWHQSAVKQQRQRAFDDFISVAEYLIAQKYTSAKHLGIEGGSNGGLLVAACMTQRPDLFGAVAAHVGVYDMIRYHKFTAGHFWISEYGDPETPEEYEALIKYSPYHKVLREGPRRYPATLILTADTDDRAVPSHSFKFLAALQQAQSETGNPIIARLEMQAGHGAGLPLTKGIAVEADVLSFFFHFLSSNKDAVDVNIKHHEQGVPI